LLALWLVDLVGVALIGTNMIGASRQQQLSATLAKPPVLSSTQSTSASFPPTRTSAIGVAIGRLVIPSIGVRETVIEGTDLQQLTFGPGHVRGTAIPGEAGNAVIAGHRTTWGRPFARLNELRPGDTITFTDAAGHSVYVVASSTVINPDDRSVLQPTNANVLTLLTCTPPHFATHRLEVRALLRSTTKAGPAAPLPPEGARMAPGAMSSLWVLLWLVLFSILAIMLFALGASTKRRWPNIAAMVAFVLVISTANVLLVEHLPAGF
jgi:sortase A